MSHIYTSNALEGFGYTENETAILLEDGLTAGGKPIRNMYAVWGQAEAYNHMYTLLGKKALTENDIKVFHLMLDGSLDNHAHTGKYRDIQVFIPGSKYPVTKPEDIREKMKALMEATQDQNNKTHPVE